MRFFFLISVLLFTSCTSQAQFQVEVAFPNLTFTRPVDLQHPGDGTNRLFVLEQPGYIRVFENNPSVTSAGVFLDITDRVNSSGNEEGLLGLAFHPDFETNGYFYVNYTANPPRRTVISRFKVSASDPNVADKSSEKIILTFSQPFSNHNGGQITFGPDGYLYIGTGDGGSGGDPQRNGQNTKTLLGKLLRIDVNKTAGGKEYAIPSDNPFVGNTAGQMEEIYAWGLRNPWRFSFDPETNMLWTGDVGQNKLEEIDIIEKGKNYGWNVMEGTQCYSPSTGCDTTGLVKPVWEYGRSLGVSVTGGFVYRGKNVPELVGEYIYADFGSGRIWGIRMNGSTPVNRDLVASGMQISSFGVDRNNELYICTFSSGGRIYRFKPTTTDVRGDVPAPEFDLHVFPNPVDRARTATVGFSLPRRSHVALSLVDALGREYHRIADAEFSAGRHEIRHSFDALSKGVYFYTLTTGEGRTSRPLLLAP